LVRTERGGPNGEIAAFGVLGGGGQSCVSDAQGWTVSGGEIVTTSTGAVVEDNDNVAGGTQSTT
jgi:hypothetical protein